MKRNVKKFKAQLPPTASGLHPSGPTSGNDDNENDTGNNENDDQPLSGLDYENLPVSRNLLRSIFSYGYEKMSPVQARVLPCILSAQETGKKISSIITAKSCTGKTSIGLIAALDNFDRNFFAVNKNSNNGNNNTHQSSNPPPCTPSVLILCYNETRAMNVVGLLKGLGRFSFQEAIGNITQRNNGGHGDEEIATSFDGQCPFTATILSASGTVTEQQMLGRLEMISGNPQYFFLVATPQALSKFIKLQDEFEDTSCFPDILRNINQVFLDQSSELLLIARGSEMMDRLLMPLAHKASFFITKTTMETEGDEFDRYFTPIYENEYGVPDLSSGEFTDHSFLKFVIRPSYDNGENFDRNKENDSSSTSVNNNYKYQKDDGSVFLFDELSFKAMQDAKVHSTSASRNQYRLSLNQWILASQKFTYVNVDREDYKFDTMLDIMDSTNMKSDEYPHHSVIVWFSTNRKAKTIFDKMQYTLSAQAVGSSSLKAENIAVLTSDGTQSVEEQEFIIKRFKQGQQLQLPAMMMTSPNGRGSSAQIPPRLQVLFLSPSCILSDALKKPSESEIFVPGGKEELDDAIGKDSSKFQNLLVDPPLYRSDAVSRNRTIVVHYDFPTPLEKMVDERVFLMKPSLFNVVNDQSHRILHVLFATISDEQFGLKESEQMLNKWIREKPSYSLPAKTRLTPEIGFKIEELEMDVAGEFITSWPSF